MAKNTPEEYLSMLEKLERSFEDDLAFYAQVESAADTALSRHDTDAFISLKDLFTDAVSRDLMARNAGMMYLRYITGAVEIERDAGYPLFTDSVNDFRSLINRCTLLTSFLRRIEFDIEPLSGEAYAFIRTNRISPYAVAAILYNMLSLLGHREEILLKLADDAMEHGFYRDAYGFLTVIEHPSDDAVALRSELEKVLSQSS